MSASLRFDDREFQSTLRKLAVNSSRSLPLFMNSRMLHIMKTAQKETPVADRSTIMAELGAAIKSQRMNKRGRMVRRYSYSPRPLVYALVNARRRKAGQPPIQPGEMEGAARKLIANRLRGIGSLRSGFTGMIGKLAYAVRESLGLSGPRVREASKATLARDGWNPTVTTEYRLTVAKAQDGPRSIHPYVVESHHKGFQIEKGEMMRHLENNMKKVFRQSGAL